MVTSSEHQVDGKIDAAITTLRSLHDADRQFFRSHRIRPRPIRLALDPAGAAWEEFWLVTEHTGTDDASFRVIFDDARGRFGRECLLENDIPLFLGVYPTLADTLDGIT